MNRVHLLLLLAALLSPALGLAKDPPTKVGLTDFAGFKPMKNHRRLASRQGVKATLKYEQIADMQTARMAHQTFPSGDGLVVVGGRTTGFKLTKTAELYQNGSWTSLPISNAHDGAFTVRLADGRYMVGGGFSANGGVGQSRTVDIYNPLTRSFTSGPQLSTARAQSMAVDIGDKVYVSGNWYADDAAMDYYNGTSFTAVGQTDGRSKPYMMADAQGNVCVVSAQTERGQSFGFYTDSDGDQLLLADKYTPTTGKTQYFGLPFTPQDYPMALPDDARPEDYHVVYSGYNCYLLLIRTTDGYQLAMLNLDQTGLYRFRDVAIPTTADDGQTIAWRGGVLVNEARQEVYLIGASGPATSQTLHVISLNYDTDEWTIASASGFSHSLLTASWTLLSNGQLACTGGGINDNTDAQRRAYLVTPPVAGIGDEDTPDGPTMSANVLVVITKDGSQTTYLLLEKPQVRFEGKQLRVVSTKADVTYQLTDILRFTYTKRNVSGIDEQVEQQAGVDYQDGVLVISQLKAGATVGVYALDGKLVRQLTAQHAGTFRLNLSALPQGVYIVKADNVSYKIMKR